MAFNLLLKSQLERFVDNLFPQIYSYGTCSTGKNDVAKVVALTGFILKRGARVSVRFSDTSTSVPSSGNITMNVNGTGAKAIYLSESNIACDYTFASYFGNNSVFQFEYDGTNWIWINRNYESDVIITTTEFDNLT